MTGEALELDGVGVRYRLHRGELHAVDGVRLTLHPGETVGVVGESGCGKTTLAQAVLRMLPDSGRLAAGSSIRLGERELTGLTDEQFRRDIRWKRIAMVFQSAMNSLNPVARIGDTLTRLTRLHLPQLSVVDSSEWTAALLEQVGLSADVSQRYPHELSGGMRQRVVIAMSLVAEPDVLIADEATTALDVVVQAQILSELNRLRHRRGLAVLVISHDMDVIAAICDRIAVMYAGQIVETGRTAEVLAAPSHPYTAALLAALPRLDGPKRRLATLAGDPPELIGDQTGCRFRDRCPIAVARCEQEPELTTQPGGRLVRCHFPADPGISPEALAEPEPTGGVS
ncbi:ABC transporter ATP-binding protein [Amycolatopsis jejuensis]|uniref:ABC transporter ATP-binding protein n=1 Tax=Amycolatopsis jejuensis TaxID=330084 RepID=UPI00068D7253|nr:ABC transporter ATP-binding protein [Amycolatopsis jejuensis]